MCGIFYERSKIVLMVISCDSGNFLWCTDHTNTSCDELVSCHVVQQSLSGVAQSLHPKIQRHYRNPGIPDDHDGVAVPVQKLICHLQNDDGLQFLHHQTGSERGKRWLTQFLHHCPQQFIKVFRTDVLTFRLAQIL